MAEQDDFQSRQEAYEQAYYDAAQAAPAPSQPFSNPDAPTATPAQEQYHADPFVAAVSDATAQREQGNSYQQPWGQGQQSYSQASYGAGFNQQNAYDPYGQYGNTNYTQQQYYAQQPYAQGYQTYVHSKDHVAAGLLAIFLGVFGVHKFYLGYNTAGFIMLGATILSFAILSPLVSIVGIIEGIIYLTKPQTVFDAEYVYGRKPWF